MHDDSYALPLILGTAWDKQYFHLFKFSLKSFMRSDFDMLSVKITFFGFCLTILLKYAPIFSKMFLVCWIRFSLLQIALLLEFACLWLANMFLPNFGFGTGSGYFFLGVYSFLFPILFFLSKQNSSSVLLILPVLQWYSRRHSPLDTMFHNGFRNSFHLSIFHYLWVQTFS